MLLVRPRNALIGAAGGVGLLLLTWLLTFHLGIARRADQAIFSGFYDLGSHGTIESIAHAVVGLCNPRPYVYLAAIPLLVALMRRRFRLAIGIGAILLGANVTTELLKPLLAQPRPSALLGGVTPVADASWPSGHATAAMTWALCLILAVPQRFRPAAAAFGAALAVGVCYSFLVLGTHYPSDALGGYLVATTWTLLGVAALRATELPRRRAREGTESRVPLRVALMPPVAALLLAVLLALVLALVHPHAVVSYAQEHGAFMLGAAGIGVLALTLATGMMLALRR